MTQTSSRLTLLSLALLAACTSTDVTAPAESRQAKGSTSTIAIPVETVGLGVLANQYRLLEQGVDAQGRTYWVEEYGVGYDALNEPVGSMVLHIMVLDTATVRTTIRTLRQRTGWTVVQPSASVYDNSTLKVTWNSPTQTITASVMNKPGRRVDDHGLVKKR